MNTPAHLIVGVAAFGQSNRTWVTLAALIGGFLPDASLYLMAGVSMHILDIPAQHVFRTLYFSDAWQQVFAIDNSFILWGIGLGIAIWLRSAWAVALTGAALLHLALDFPFHSEDARMHFWPLTDWKFHSPISYWDSGQGAGWFGPLELVLVIALTIYIFFKIKDLWVRIVTAILCAMQVLPFFIWRLYF